jgi:hypothetical protein
MKNRAINYEKNRHPGGRIAGWVSGLAIRTSSGRTVLRSFSPKIEVFI